MITILMFIIMMCLTQEYQNEGSNITSENYSTFMPFGKAVIEKPISTADTVNRGRRYIYILLVLILCMHDISFEEQRHYLPCARVKMPRLFCFPDEFCPTEWH
jgi:hypothetical protein